MGVPNIFTAKTVMKSSEVNNNFSYLLNCPRGYLLNGKIVPSIASNNLTVAIKGLDGDDPSSTNPVHCRIGDTVRSITSALSVTKNAGTNWFNSGSNSELATKEVDYFVYLGYNATDGVVIGFSRIVGYEYDSFSTTTTNEKYCAISTISNAAAGDDYELIGRFAATLSAGAGYTWTVPTFTNKNLIQRPIFQTRWLDWVPTLAASGSMTYTASASVAKYKLNHDDLFLVMNADGTLGGTASSYIKFSTPFSMAISTGEQPAGSAIISDSGIISGYVNNADANDLYVARYGGGNYNLGADKKVYVNIRFQI